MMTSFGSSSLGTGCSHGRPSCGCVGLGDLSGFCCSLSGYLSLVQFGDGVLDAAENLSHALFSFDDHGLLGSGHLVSFSSGLLGILGAGLYRRNGGAQSGDLHLGLLGGRLCSLSGSFGLLVLGDFHLELVLGVGQLPSEGLHDGLLAYEGCLSGLSGLEIDMKPFMCVDLIDCSSYPNSGAGEAGGYSKGGLIACRLLILDSVVGLDSGAMSETGEFGAIAIGTAMLVKISAKVAGFVTTG